MRMGVLFNKVWFLIVVAIFIISVPKIFPVTEITEGISVENFEVYLDERISNIMDEYDIPGANVAVIKKGELIWANSYGFADLESGRKMTLDTRLRVESISKSVTAWGIMKLVEQGRLHLDVPVIKYLESWNFPESEFPVEKITLRHLLSHNSGLPLGDFTNRYSPLSVIPSLRETLFKEAVLKQEPGVSFSYSNTGYNLLELLIEEITGKDFAEYMQQEILIPLGMNDSNFSWYEYFFPAVPNGYNLQGEIIPVYIYPEKASGGLFATIEDIADFVAAGMKNLEKQKILTPQSIDLLYTSVVEKIGVYGFVFDSYGCGHYIEYLSNGYKAVSHGGQGAGWMTHFHFVPDTGDGIIILTNSQRSWPFIAYLLSDWAEWNGFSRIGMTKIIWVIYILWIIIGLILSLLLFQISRIISGLYYRKRNFVLPSSKLKISDVVKVSISAIIITCLVWCINQDYLFITSLFPIASKWFGVSSFSTALVVLLSVVFPKQDNKKTGKTSFWLFQSNA